MRVLSFGLFRQAIGHVRSLRMRPLRDTSATEVLAVIARTGVSRDSLRFHGGSTRSREARRGPQRFSQRLLQSYDLHRQFSDLGVALVKLQRLLGSLTVQRLQDSIEFQPQPIAFHRQLLELGIQGACPHRFVRKAVPLLSHGHYPALEMCKIGTGLLHEKFEVRDLLGLARHLSLQAGGKRIGLSQIRLHCVVFRTRRAAEFSIDRHEFWRPIALESAGRFFRMHVWWFGWRRPSDESRFQT